MRSNKSNDGDVSRRKFLASSTAAVTQLAFSQPPAAQQSRESGQAGSDRSKSDPGPTNAALDTENPSSVEPQRARRHSLMKSRRRI